MKIQKEHIFIFIIGLFLLSALLENIVAPLKITLPSAYSYLSPEIYSKYPFTTVFVIIRAISLFFTPLFFLSFIEGKDFLKAAILLVIGALVQLYSLQQLMSGTTLITLEWAIALSIAGGLTIISTVIFIIKGILVFAKTKFNLGNISFEDIDTEDE